MTKTRKKGNLEELIPDANLRDRMVSHLYSKKPLLSEGSVFSELLQSLVNKMLEGEMDNFLVEEKERGEKNKRNGYTKKSVLSSIGNLSIQTPRDRYANFEPEIIGKRQRQISSGIDNQILALYGQGNSIEDIRRLLLELYGVTISSGKLSAITDQILPELQAWRTRPLKAFYTIIYLDAIFFKVRHEGKYSERAFYSVYGVDADGQRDVLGLYINKTEGASSWGLVLEDIKERGVEDVLIFTTDDLSGFSNAISEVYPQSIIQKCIVHQVRTSTRFCDNQDSREIRKDLRSIYTSTTREAAATALEAFSVKWSKKYPKMVKSWYNKWEELMAFLDFPKEMQRLIYTTNPVEALHRILRKLIKAKGAWPSETALTKQIYVSLKYNEKSWKRNAYGWKAIQRDLKERYGERYTRHISDV